MELEIKRKVLAYLQGHDDGSQDAAELIRKMENECCYADVDVYSVCVEDLEGLSDDTREELRSKLGRTDENWTLEDCQAVANALADQIADDYIEDLYNAIHYDL